MRAVLQNERTRDVTLCKVQNEAGLDRRRDRRVIYIFLLIMQFGVVIDGQRRRKRIQFVPPSRRNRSMTRTTGSAVSLRKPAAASAPQPAKCSPTAFRGETPRPPSQLMSSRHQPFPDRWFDRGRGPPQGRYHSSPPAMTESFARRRDRIASGPQQSQTTSHTTVFHRELDIWQI